MSSVELQQARELQQAPAPEPANKKPGVNGDLGPASKSSSKPQKGIMGMFANKSAPKNQDKSKETEMKPEQKEDVRVVLLQLTVFRVSRVGSLYIYKCVFPF